MTHNELINKVERQLHAAKTNLKYMKNRRWIAENYTAQPATLTPDIEQIEQEITAHRKTLRNLYSTIQL